VTPRPVAHGWVCDPATLDDALLGRLLALNLERAAGSPALAAVTAGAPGEE
jgi:hypothetical protein